MNLGDSQGALSILRFSSCKLEHLKEESKAEVWQSCLAAQDCLWLRVPANVAFGRQLGTTWPSHNEYWHSAACPLPNSKQLCLPQLANTSFLCFPPTPRDGSSFFYCFKQSPCVGVIQGGVCIMCVCSAVSLLFLPTHPCGYNQKS